VLNWQVLKEAQLVGSIEPHRRVSTDLAASFEDLYRHAFAQEPRHRASSSRKRDRDEPDSELSESAPEELESSPNSPGQTISSQASAAALR
jgi:hypothetical protein